MSTCSERAYDALEFSQWWQIAAAIVMMALVSPYQYVWSSIQGPLARNLGLSLPALGLVFTLFVLFLGVAVPYRVVPRSPRAARADRARGRTRQR